MGPREIWALSRSLFYHVYAVVLELVLVLSEAVLVIVIDVSMVLRTALRDTTEFQRHSGQQRQTIARVS